MKVKIKPSNWQSDVSQVLLPYSVKWNEWADSHACFLTLHETVLIQLYKRTNSYTICAERLNKSIVDIANDLANIIFKLKTFRIYLEQWEIHCIYERQADYKLLTASQKLMITPVICLPISKRLKLKLRSLGVSSLKEFIKLIIMDNSEIIKCLETENLQELNKFLIKHRMSGVVDYYQK